MDADTDVFGFVGKFDAHATIEGGSPHEVNVAYRVSPDLNDDTNYVVSALNEPLRQSINYATSQAIRPLLEQNAREEAEQTQRDADQPTPESAPAEPAPANDTVSNL